MCCVVTISPAGTNITPRGVVGQAWANVVNGAGEANALLTCAHVCATAPQRVLCCGEQYIHDERWLRGLGWGGLVLA